MLRAVIRNARILDGRAFIGMGLLGLAFSLGTIPDVTRVLMFLVSLVLYVAYAFAINNCFDADTDSINPRKRKKNPVASGELGFGAGLASSLAMALLGLMLAATLGTGELVMYLSMTLLATVYSAPPRIKARPVIDVLSHGAFFGALPFLYGAYLDGSITMEEWSIAAAVFLYSLALELRNHLEDYESDLKAGLRTTPIVIGRGLSETLVLVFSAGAVGLVLAGAQPSLGLLGIAVYGLRTNYRLIDAAMVTTLLLRASGVM
ncbi:4-hydroxybenzoate polyprenyltransferase [Thermococcus indicus]|uniref:4-hydroxybenzoate polyprenyltransferase n=1 Tax=Thermococcus indicus TaxID=2586643 RepID=A0A4Y5SM90_9EURY|nr:UbiA family prenyltransferase [Thermococcus indicus]QDA32008.1 4-hydroxybenzoate polyprenyltransferase [Thermococcus indicus]